MPEAIKINSGEYITELTLSLSEPLDISGNFLGGTVNLSGFPNLTGITASGNGITQLIGVSGSRLLQTLRFENNNLTKQNLENLVTHIYANQRFITGSANKNVNFNLTGASMGKIDRLLRLTGVNKYDAELDKLNFNIFYAVNGEADQTWNGAGANNNLSTAANWINGQSPLEYDALYFSGATRTNVTNDLPTDTQLNGITFNSGAATYSLTGNRFILTFDGINNNSTNAQTIWNSIILSGSGRSINCNRGQITLNGNIGGSGNLTKNGSGVLQLSGNNTYTGNTFINTGVISVLNNNPFGTGSVFCSGGAGGISVNVNAAPANTIINNRIFINGERPSFGNNISCSKSGTFNGLITVGPANRTNRLNVQNGATMTINGGITGGSTFGNILTMNGSGTFILTGSPIVFENSNSTPLYSDAGTETVIIAVTGNKFNNIRMGGTIRTDVPLAINNDTVFLGFNNNRPGRINLNGNNQVFRNLQLSVPINTVAFSDISGNNIFNNSSTFANLTLNNTLNTSYVGSINGNINLIKSGASTVTFISGNMSSGIGLRYSGTTTITGGGLQTRTPFSDPLLRISSVSFSAGTTMAVQFSSSPASGETFRLLPGDTVNNYSIITLQGSAAGRTATYNRTGSVLTITN